VQPPSWRALGVAVTLALSASAAACGDTEEEAAPEPRPPSETTAAPAVPTTAGTTTTVPAPLSPLTGLPLASSQGPDRPPVVVKVDNHRQARPQVGLEHADLVFEEQVEGVTRFAAVYWTTGGEVGPVRSARTSDIDLLTSLGAPVFAWSGGNDYVRWAVAGSALVDVGYEGSPGLYWRAPDRFGPHNLFTEVEAVAAAGSDRSGPPTAPFERGAGAPGVAIAGLNIGFEGVSATWAWDAAEGRWARYQDGAPHRSASGAHLGAPVVIVLGTWYVASAADYSSPEAVTVGEGPFLLLQPDGTMVEGTWSRSGAADPFDLFDAAGAPVFPPAGVTWVELPSRDRSAVLDAAEVAALRG
jgi:hypothetical protein